MLDHIRALPKPQDLADLQARVDCLLKENGELKEKVEEGKSLRKEMGEPPGATPSTIPAPTPCPEFVTPPVTQPDPLLQEPILDKPYIQ